MNNFLIILFTSLFSFSLFACENQESDFKVIENLAGDVNLATDKLINPTMDIHVNWDGNGAIRVLLDSAGNFAGIKLSYKGELMGILDLKQLQSGESIKFHEKGISPDPLILSLKSDEKINPKSELTFSFKALMYADKPFFKEYTISVKKINGVWKAYQGSKVVTSTTLDPKVSWGTWTGSFKSVKFE